MYLLGYDIGSSSIKAALVNAETGALIQVVHSPEVEMDIVSPEKGWAEQDPEVWWKHVCRATRVLLDRAQVFAEQILSIGISYQMHGLVLVDKEQRVLRPAIIWCDSRAVEIGEQAFEELGREKCLTHYLNSPANFTASKLRWVKENEPELFARIDKVLLPGDYIAMKLTGEVTTTISGLSEGVFWDFSNHTLAKDLLSHFEIPVELIPPFFSAFASPGRMTKTAAALTRLRVGTPVTYRAGDQPNNAFSLGVIRPGEVAATGGTSGVIYGVTDELIYDAQSRINSFAHVNHSADQPRIGLLLCINGAGILYGWMRKQLIQETMSYAEMEQMIRSVPVGADGLTVLPFGNGAERMLGNQQPGAQINHLNFNRHQLSHLLRAGLEGIAFSFVYGFQVLKELGLHPQVIKVGNDNLFQSSVFSQTVANLLNCAIEVVATTGAVGAAKASGVPVNVYNTLEEATIGNVVEKQYTPESDNTAYELAYQAWEKDLIQLLNDG